MKEILLKPLTIEFIRKKSCVNCIQYRGEKHDYNQKNCERCMEAIKSSQRYFEK